MLSLVLCFSANQIFSFPTIYAQAQEGDGSGSTGDGGSTGVGVGGGVAGDGDGGQHILCDAAPTFVDEGGDILAIPEPEGEEGDDQEEESEDQNWSDGNPPLILSNSSRFPGSLVTSDAKSAHVLMPMTRSDPTSVEFGGNANGVNSTSVVQWNTDTGRFSALSVVSPGSPVISRLDVLSEPTCCGDEPAEDFALHVVFTAAPDLNNGTEYPVLTESSSDGIKVTKLSWDTFSLLLGMGLGGFDPPVPPPGLGPPLPLPPLPPGVAPLPGGPEGTAGQLAIRVQLALERFGSKQMKCRFLNFQAGALRRVILKCANPSGAGAALRAKAELEAVLFWIGQLGC
jgi:hypothetical protein